MKKPGFANHAVEPMHEIDHGWCRSLYAIDPNGHHGRVLRDDRTLKSSLQTEEEALRLLRQAPEEFAEETRKEPSVARRRPNGSLALADAACTT